MVESVKSKIENGTLNYKDLGAPDKKNSDTLTYYLGTNPHLAEWNDAFLILKQNDSDLVFLRVLKY